MYNIHVCTAGFSVRRIFPTPRLKDLISPCLRGLRGQALNQNVGTAHHDHEKLFFGVKLFYATFITRTQFTPNWSTSQAPGKFKSGGGLSRGHETYADKSGNRTLVEPLLRRLADVVRLGMERTSPLGTERHRNVPAEEQRTMKNMIEAQNSQ